MLLYSQTNRLQSKSYSEIKRDKASGYNFLWNGRSGVGVYEYKVKHIHSQGYFRTP